MDPQNPPEQQTPESQPASEPAPAPEAQSPPPQPQATPTPAPVQQNPTPTPAAKTSKGYGKRPVWQWVLIYLVVAIIVYGLIYVLFIHKSGSSGSSTGY